MRPAPVSRGGQIRSHRHLDEMWDAECLLDLFTGALAEGVVLHAVHLEIAHVLHHRDARHTQLGEHLHALDHVHEGQPLGGRHDHRRTDGHRLADGELNVTRSRGEVHNEVVEVAPVGGGEQLLDDARHHGPAHDGAALPGPAEGHGRHALVLHRRDHRRLGIHHQHLRLRRDHGWQGRAVHIRIKDAHLRAHHRQRVGQIHRHGGLPDPPLATGHRDDVAHALEASWHVFRHERLDGLRGHGEIHVLDPLQLAHILARLALELALDGARWRRELKVELHFARLHVRLEVLDKAARNDVEAEVRVDDLSKLVQNCEFGLGHRTSVRALRGLSPETRFCALPRATPPLSPMWLLCILT
mmetsp:Transcript_29792/g.50068  ORF Transcript_29792/g.50068 Transcript_29792/m.50068 type:complete len:357 (+) Transcript_29792:740-1810(+)